jgi:DsbC/DsbD-like thiol-disulfide interchange protein
MKWTFVLLGLGLGLVAPPASATPTPEVPKELLKAELVADTTAVRPGQRFQAAVLLRIHPEWHIYWKNPGDAGLATSVEWQLPPGFEAGELRWPVPEAWNQPGNVLGYGYSGTVVLGAEIQAPAELPPGDGVPIRAVVGWLGCRHVCIPGKSTPELLLPVSESPEPANEELFSAWAISLPQPLLSPETPLTAKTAGHLVEGENTGNFMVLLEWKAPASQITWFPAAHPALTIESSSLQTEAESSQIAFSAKVLPGQALDTEALETVVAYTDQDGNRRGVIVPVPLREVGENSHP